MNVNVVDSIVVGFCGVALLLAVWIGQGDLAQTIAVGLIGYIGGNAQGKSKANSKNEENV